eukprot:Em0004g685a
MCFATALAQNCTQLTNCASCTSFTQTTCYYCPDDNTCKQLTAGSVFNFNTQSCSKLRYFVGQCTVPTYGFAIIIAAGILLVLVMCVCVCCCIFCCVRRRRKRYIQLEQVQYDKGRADIKDKHSKKKADRKVKYDEYRQKWGTGAFADNTSSTNYVRMNK